MKVLSFSVFILQKVVFKIAPKNCFNLSKFGKTDTQQSFSSQNKEKFLTNLRRILEHSVNRNMLVLFNLCYLNPPPPIEADKCLYDQFQVIFNTETNYKIISIHTIKGHKWLLGLIQRKLRNYGPSWSGCL